MKKVFVLAALMCFAIGFGVMSFVPQTAKADAPPPCSSTCYRDFCPGPAAGPCESPYVNRSRCYAYLTSPCDFPVFYDCKCVWTGCCTPL